MTLSMSSAEADKRNFSGTEHATKLKSTSSQMGVSQRLCRLHTSNTRAKVNPRRRGANISRFNAFKTERGKEQEEEH